MHFAKIFFLMAVQISSFAQTKIIKGKVLSLTDKQPIPFAHVYLQRGSSGTVSNNMGLFEFNVPESIAGDTLIISSLGYKDYRIAISEAYKSNEATFALTEESMQLAEVQITGRKITIDEIIETAVKNLRDETYYPDASFKLEGFFRETHTADEKPLSIVEAAFSAYATSVTRPIEDIVIEQFRKVQLEDIDEKGPERRHFDRNRLIMLLGISTNFTVLLYRGLENGGTTWAVGKRPYQVEEISSYKNRKVLVVAHNNPTVQLKLGIDAENGVVIRSEYRSRQPKDSLSSYFWRYSNSAGSSCGFYETHQIYEYKEFEGQLYPYFFYRRDASQCFDRNGKEVLSSDLAEYELLIGKIIKEVRAPENLMKLKKYKSMSEQDYEYNPEFWKDYNIIRDRQENDSLSQERRSDIETN